jgi:uncharacterized damage-inducible protein DinB
VNIQDIRTLFDYNIWANKRILAATAGISQEEYTTPAANGWGSLRGILFHTFEAEYFWRYLCQHGVFVKEIREADYPTLDDLLAGWQAEEAARQEYLAGLSDTDLTNLVRYTTDTGIKRERLLWHCFFHMVNHGMQHRSEAAAILTSYGRSPGDLDFPLFLNEL